MLKPQEFKQTPFVTVEAIQLSGENADDIVKWINRDDTEIFKTSTKNQKNYILSIYIQTSQGKLCARSGDYIVKYGDGSFQVLNKKQFSQRYETQNTSNGYSPTVIKNEIINTLPRGPYDILMNPWGVDTSDRDPEGYYTIDEEDDI